MPMITSEEATDCLESELDNEYNSDQENTALSMNKIEAAREDLEDWTM
jgi:hypothetical protein